MRAIDLTELAAFDAVARHRSFRRAAEERGVTASAISHAVSDLEARLGIRLLNRTTRSVSPTDAGAMLQAHLSPAFGDIGAALDALNQFRDTPFGKVRINVPNSVAPFVLGRVIASYVQGIQLPEVLTVIGAAAVLLLAAVIASVAPAARAARIDVMRALRSE